MPPGHAWEYFNSEKQPKNRDIDGTRKVEEVRGYHVVMQKWDVLKKLSEKNNDYNKLSASIKSSWIKSRVQPDIEKINDLKQKINNALELKNEMIPILGLADQPAACAKHWKNTAQGLSIAYQQNLQLVQFAHTLEQWNQDFLNEGQNAPGPSAPAEPGKEEEQACKTP